jgi:SdrD B-like domain/Secretion system C-terminal sorting domain
MKKLICFFSTILLLIITQVSNGQISGTIFRDYDGNATKSTLEPGVEGISINAYNASGTLLANIISNSQGLYSIPLSNGLAVRLEFIIPTSSSCGTSASFDFSAPTSLANASSVQFVTAPASNINYAINSPKDYTGNITTNVPQIYTSSYVNGDPLPIGAGTQKAIHKIAYDISHGSSTVTTNVATVHTVGSIWGLAASAKANRLFTSAVLRRHAGYGPQGSGGIYMVDPSGLDLVTNFADLDALGFPTRGTGAYLPIVTGAVVTYTTQVGTNVERGLPTTNTASRDIAAFEQIGKVGLGDLEISDDGRYLYVINLFDKKLYEIDIQNANAPVLPTAANIRSWPIPNPPHSGGDIRPWAIKVHRGKLYVGLVCDAQTSQLAADLKASIYEFDPSGTGVFAGEVLSFPLNYTKGTSLGSQAGWYPWTNNFALLPYGGGTNTSYPQPILSDIEIDDDGSFILGFIDRSGMQAGTYNFSVDISDNGYYYGYNGGDILRAYKNPLTCAWELETNGKEGISSPKSVTTGVNNNEGPGGGEFYIGDYVGEYSSNNEMSQGGLCLLRGTGEVVLTAQDPVQASELFGLKWLSNSTGLENKSYGNLYANDEGTFGKAAAMGDVELMPTLSPIEIGNKVWNDTNGNGIQDAGEAGIAGVMLELYNPLTSTVLGNVTTASNGSYYFTSATGTNIQGVAYNLNILPNTNYILRLATSGIGNDWDPTANSGAGGVRNGSDLNNLLITTTSTIGSGAPNLSDNDAAIINSIPQVSITTGDYGQNNHNIDFGFKPSIVLSTKYTSFTALPIANQVQLQWAVSEQINITEYEAQTSTDGRTFTTIATVQSNNNPTDSYKALHTTVQIGINYYRIKAIEKDGSQSYSAIRKVNIGKEGEVNIYPNPVTTGVLKITLTGSMVNQKAVLSILSKEGKLISQQQIIKTSQSEMVDVSKLSSGSYILKIVTNAEVINKPIQIVR